MYSLQTEHSGNTPVRVHVSRKLTSRSPLWSRVQCNFYIDFIWSPSLVRGGGRGGNVVRTGANNCLFEFVTKHCGVLKQSLCHAGDIVRFFQLSNDQSSH